MSPDMSLELWNPVILGFTALILVETAIILWRGTKQAARKSTWEATNGIYIEWYCDELIELRRYFYTEFLPLHRSKLTGKEGLKEIETVISEDEGRARRLCYFFDRVGWLGAAELIDIDYVLGPMQHSVRRVWIAMEPFIQKERKPESAKLLDPVYQFGFEWLFKRSNETHQAKLVRNKFRNPKLLSRKQSKILQVQIDRDEAKFRKRFLVRGD